MRDFSYSVAYVSPRFFQKTLPLIETNVLLKMEWKKVLFILIISSLISCSLLNPIDYDLKQISGINYKEDVIYDYFIGDLRERNAYFINYEGNRYLARMPLGTDTLISLKFLKDKLDSAGNWYENEVIDVFNDLDCRKRINEMCLIFRSIWQLDSSNIYLLRMIVDKNKDIALIIEWMHSKERSLIIITEDFISKNLDDLVAYIKDRSVVLTSIDENVIKDKTGYIQFDKHLYYKKPIN